MKASQQIKELEKTISELLQDFTKETELVVTKVKVKPVCDLVDDEIEFVGYDVHMVMVAE